MTHVHGDVISHGMVDFSLHICRGTAAACTAAVGQGACIVRVHDVAEMGDVVTVADAIFRRGPR